jgi:hypothetical protein
MYVMYSVLRRGDVVRAYVGISDEWEEVAYIRDGHLHKTDIPIPPRVEKAMWAAYRDRKRARNPVEVLDLPGPTLWEYTQHILATGRVLNFKELLEPHAAVIENQT